jgi:hypothetical protein
MGPIKSTHGKRREKERSCGWKKNKALDVIITMRKPLSHTGMQACTQIHKLMGTNPQWLYQVIISVLFSLGAHGFGVQYVGE